MNKEEERARKEEAGNQAFGLHPKNRCNCRVCLKKKKDLQEYDNSLHKNRRQKKDAIQAKTQLHKERNQADVIYFQLTDHWTDEEISRIIFHLSKLLHANHHCHTCKTTLEKAAGSTFYCPTCKEFYFFIKPVERKENTK